LSRSCVSSGVKVANNGICLKVSGVIEFFYCIKKFMK
jgi:hypothetical protein